MWKLLCLMLVMFFTSTTNAQFIKNDFTDGYALGYKLVKGEYKSDSDDILEGQWNSIGLNVSDSDSINDSTFKILPLMLNAEYNADVSPGDGEQYMTCFGYSESDYDRIYAGHDIGGVWVSLDAGISWNNLKNRGLFSSYIIGMDVDPLNKNRLVVMSQTLYSAAGSILSDPSSNYQGLYFSNDGGLNWKRVLSKTRMPVLRWTTRNIAYAPSSKSPDLGYATRWYSAICEYTPNGDNNCDDGLFYSDDGGESWNEARKLPSETFGNLILGIRVHPTNSERLYLYGNKGLQRLENATSPDSQSELLSGKNGLPEGEVYGNLYLSPIGDTLIVAVSKKGIYKTTNGAESWALLYAWSNIQKCFVNESYPDRIYATALRSANQQLRVSKTGGQTWNSKVISAPRPGRSGSWNTYIQGDFGWIIPDPRDPDKAFAHGNAKHHRTYDGGNNWVPSDDYFNGSNHIGRNHEQMFDPLNPNRFCFFMADKGVWYTDSGGKWFNPSTIKRPDFDLPHTTCFGGAMHPDAKTGIILVNIGRQQGKLLRSTDNGKTWVIVANEIKSRWFISFDQQNPDYCYQGNSRSSDAGKTWYGLPIPSGAMIVGMSFTDGRVIYAKDTRNIWRSMDRGDTWEKVATSPWNLSDIFRVNPKNQNVFYTSSSSGQITKWDLDAQGQKWEDLDVLNGGKKENGFLINRFALDRRFPDVMYAFNLRDNTGNKLFRSADGGKTWDNLSEGIPNACLKAIEVSPVTGELFIGGGLGTRILSPPYPASNTAFEWMDYDYKYIDKEY